MSLPGWNADNVLGLTISCNNVEEDLTDFPVLISLSSSSGQGGIDATYVFNKLTTSSGSYVNRKKIAVTTTISGVETKLFTEIERWDDTTASGNEQAWLWVKVPTIVSGTDTDLYLYYDKNQTDQDERTTTEAGDTFTGSNGDLPNQELWRTVGTPTIQGNKVRTKTVSNVEDGVILRSNVTGDFDIQVDYSLDSAPAIDAWQIMLDIRIDNLNRISIGRSYVGGLQRYIVSEFIGGSQTNYYSSTTTDTSGKLKVTRVGSTWHGYYWNSGWVEIESGFAVGSGPITSIELRAATWGSEPDITGYFDNFIINSADSISGFVGDITERPAQEVWDDNFNFVCHTAQDPNGDVADSIKDSTRNEGHATPAGSMTTADLVDGQIGKAIAHDGVDDKLVSTAAGPSGTGNRTIEVVILPPAEAPQTGSIVFWGENLAEEKWTFRLETTTPAGALRTECNGGYLIGTTDLRGLWHSAASVFSGTNIDDVLHYVDGVLDAETAHLSKAVNTATTYKITTAGSHGAPWTYQKNTIDEVRVSKIVRSAAWIKASHHSNFDSLITFDAPSFLSEFDNRIELTIDHTKVDAALSYFPVHVHLSNSSGSTSQDVREVFDEVGANSKKIAITASDGVTKLFVEIERWDQANKEAWLWVRVPDISASIDTTLYLYYDNTVDDQDVRVLSEATDAFTGTNDDLPNQGLWRVFTGTPTIQNNQLRSQATAAPSQDSVYSRFNVTGDFDIQVDYSIPSPPSGVRSWQMMLRIRIDINNSVSIGRWGNDTDQDYLKDERIAGTPTYDHSAPTTDTSGKLRITRVGSTWHAYYWNGSAWVEVGTGSAVGSGPITMIELCSNTWTTNPAYTGYFDNFTINSADGITGFVDDTLGQPAKEVWDDNFKLVCHMGEDPSKPGGANTTHLDEDMAVITDWVNADNINGVSSQVTFEGKSCLKMACSTAAENSRAHSYRDAGSYGNRVVAELSVYCDAIGTIANVDQATLEIRAATVKLAVSFASDGLFIYDGVSWNEVGTNIVVQGSWQKWVFDIDFTTPVSATVDIYLDDILIASGVDCSYTGTYTDGNVHLLQRGGTTNNQLSYVDYIKIGDGIVDAIKDSTRNVNHGTPDGTMLTEDLIDGQIGKAIDFDGSDDLINVGSFNPSSVDLTLEILLDITSLANSPMFISKRTDWTTTAMMWQFGYIVASYNKVLFTTCGDTGEQFFFDYIPPLATPKCLTLVHDSGALDYLYADGALEDSHNAISFDTGVTSDVVIGARSATGVSHLNGYADEVRISNVTRSASWIKATYYSNFDDLIKYGTEVIFTFTGPAPVHLSTVYGTSHILQLTTTVSGNYPSYVYNAVFYDAYDDSQIGSTVSGTNSGQVAYVVMQTPSGIEYNWYLVATSSGQEDTSTTYNFTNRFLCSGTTEVNSVLTEGVSVRLYRRSDGALIGSTASISGGLFEIESTYNESHYAIAMHPTDSGTNALIYDWLTP